MFRFSKLLHFFGGMNFAVSKPRHYRTVVVEGNIASGKTSFLDYFQKFDKVKIFSEPVEKWRNVDGHNLLELLYRDVSRWSFAFQMYADFTRLCLHQSNEGLQATDTKLMERSLFSGRYCFAENALNSGNLDPAEYAVLNQYFQWTTKTQQDLLHMDLIVYLRTKPEICYERLAKRCRHEEMNIPLDYLAQLHGRYESWLIEKRYPVPAELIILDANENLDKMHEAYDRLAEKILSNT